jgi:gliding motility-associated-like protein
VDADNGLGCITSNTVTVNVNSAPSLSIAATSTALCTSGSVTLTATGATSYTWNPTAATTSSIVDAPSVTTTYTVTGEDVIGCSSTQTITIGVGSPTITAVSAPSILCEGSAGSLSASGATSYTWNPGGLTGANVIVSPTTTTTYTVDGDNGSGCIATTTVIITVTPGPTVTAVANPTIVCAGSSATLTGSGTTSYTWIPQNTSGNISIVTPTIATTYTLVGDNGGCVATTTVFVDVTPGPANVTATVSGDITCTTLSVSLSGNSTSTGVNYSWNGPSSYTSSVQSPTDIVTPGDYTLTVTDPITGCSSTASTTVISNTVIPFIGILSPSPVLGCNTTVTLTVVTTLTPTLIFNWDGPLFFNSSVQTPTTTLPGDYTVTVTDPITGCQNSATITVGSSTVVPAFTATIIPATCSGTVANNDGTILISGNSSTDTYDLSQAATYTGTATYSTGSIIPLSGILTNTLNNPVVSTPYTIRVFSTNGCFKDTTVFLTPTNCSTVSATVLGMTKAASTPTFVNNNAYNVTYTVVATNASSIDLTGFSIIDNLNNTFPLPTTYSVISTPVVTSLNSSLSVNSSYNGASQNDMLIPATSTLAAGRKDTIVFTVQINPNGFFGPFNNSAIGFGFDGTTTVSDSSNTGFAWDPDNDGDPTNNDAPTVVTLTPNTQIGVAKSGSVSGILPDKTLDVTYVITVKNLGNDTIKSVQVFDTLRIPSPATFTIKSGPTATGSLTANSNYNGNSDIGLLVATGSALAPGQTETITLILNITPNGVRSLTNTAIGAGFGADGGIVRDSSETGNEPDPNGNGSATEAGENSPTVLELPDVNLFIPEVFTPDGDGKNDFFVIKGIEGRTVKITVFNRWGNIVYENDAYDNTWEGMPNVSGLIIGNSKLPQGTYYYIVEFEDGNDKNVNGYVVLQY